MKYINANPEMVKLVKEFIANPDAEFPQQECKNKLTNAVEMKPVGFTQKQQALLMVSLLIECVFTEYSGDSEAFAKALQIAFDLANGSASRQAMEKFGWLGETNATKRGTDVAALAAKWMPKAPAETPAETPKA